MATLSYQRAAISGTALTMASAAGGGDKVRPSQSGLVLVTNGGVGSITVTVAVPGNTRYGGAEPDVAVSVAAGASKLIGPFPNDLADPSDGLVALTYSGVTSVTVAAIAV